MTIDVATLVFDFKSDTAVTAEQRMDSLIAKGERLEAVSRRVRKATDMVGDGHRSATSAADRAVQANMALAQSEGAVERAARAAAKEQQQAERQAAAAARARAAEVRAARQLEAAAMRELVAAAKAYERDQARTKAAVDALRMSVDPLGAAVARTNAEIAEANRLHSIGAIDAKEHASAISTLTARLHALDDVQARTAGSMRVAQRAGVDLSRQFADVGVQAAMMTSPLMILIMQGPQIADTLGMMRARGVSVGDAFREIGGFLGPVLAMLAPLALAVGAVAGGFGLLHRELSKGYPDDITKGLGLTEEQLDRVENKTVTFGDTMIATFTVLGRHIMDTWVGGVLRWMGEQWNLTLDAMTSGAFDATTNMMAYFTASYKTIVANWSNLPGAMGVIMANTVNAMNRAMEWFINGNTELVNKFQRAWGRLTNTQPLQIPKVTLPTYDPAKFGGADIAADFQGAFERDRAAFQAGGRALLGEIRREAIDRAQDRVREEAGKPNKGSSSNPRDVTDERSAQIARMIAQAQQEELQARLGLAEGVKERADLERRIIDAGHAEKIADLDGQIARIKDDKKNAEAAAQIAQLEELKLTHERIAGLRKDAVTRQEERDLIRDRVSIQTADLENQIAIAEGTRDLAKTGADRRKAEMQILAAQEEIERLKLQEIIETTASVTAEHKIAAKRLELLGVLQANDREVRRQRDLAFATEEATRAIDDIARAIREQDWGSAFSGLFKAIDGARVAFSVASTRAERMSAGGSLLSSIGGAVGGSAGSVISSIGAGFSAAGSAAGMAGTLGGLGSAIAGMAGPIGIAVAGFSLLNSVLSNQAAKKRAKQEQERRDFENAAAIAQEQANRQAELQIELLRASGDELAAVAAEREKELAALDRTSAAIQRQIYALEDWRKTVTEAESAVAKAEADLRAAYDAERERLLGIIAGVDAARGQLQDAYQRERSAIEDAVDGVEQLADSLRAFRRELDLNPFAMLDPAQNRAVARGRFFSAAPEDMAGAGRTFLDASMASARTVQEYLRDRADVANAIDQAASAAEAQLSEAERQIQLLDAQVAGLLAVNDNVMSVEEAIRNLQSAEQAAAIAQAQLTALDVQVGALLKIDNSVLSVAQAIANLSAATQALADAQAAKPATTPQGPTYQIVGAEGYVDMNPDLAALYASGSGMARGRSKAEFGLYHWQRYGQGEDRFYRPFALGGAFTNGVVNGPMAFDMGVMGEAGPEAIMPLARTSGGQLGVVAANDGLKEEIRALRQEIAGLRASAEETARNTRDAKDVLEGSARGQLTLSTEAA